MQNFATLKQQSGTLWQQYIEHPFVRDVATGQLPLAAFQHYLQQDYLYLQHYTRAWGLAVYKSENLQQMRRAAANISTLLDTEFGLHISYSQGFGITSEAMEQASESTACIAYTRYLLDAGMQGDITDLYTALMPCFIGYAEMARYLIAQDFCVLENNPYREWIETYSGSEYQQAAAAAHIELDGLLAQVSPSKFAKLSHIFNTATRMEIGFWQMGLDVSF